MAKKTRFLVESAAVAALYAILTYVFPFSVGPFQVRISEALSVLPWFMPSAVPGLTMGCFISGIICGCTLPDLIFGTSATLLGAVGSYLLRKRKWLAPIPAIVANTLILPVVFLLVYGENSYLYFLLTTFFGEVISCGILGTGATLIISRYGKYIKKN